jgi:hypothetical protein
MEGVDELVFGSGYGQGAVAEWVYWWRCWARGKRGGEGEKDGRK